MRNKFILLLIGTLLLIPLVYAGTMPIHVKPLLNEKVQPLQTFIYTFNFSMDSLCTNIVLSHTETVVTLEDGTAFINITLPENISSIPIYLCEYKGDPPVLRKVHSFSYIIFNSVYAQRGNFTNLTSTNYFKNGQFINSTEEIKELLKTIYWNQTEIQNETIIRENNRTWVAESIQNNTILRNGTDATFINLNATTITSDSIFGKFIGSVSRWWDNLWVKAINATNTTTTNLWRDTPNNPFNTTTELDGRYWNTNGESGLTGIYSNTGKTVEINFDDETINATTFTEDNVKLEDKYEPKSTAGNMVMKFSGGKFYIKVS